MSVGFNSNNGDLGVSGAFHKPLTGSEVFAEKRAQSLPMDHIFELINQEDNASLTTEELSQRVITVLNSEAKERSGSIDEGLYSSRVEEVKSARKKLSYLSMVPLGITQGPEIIATMVECKRMGDRVTEIASQICDRQNQIWELSQEAMGSLVEGEATEETNRIAGDIEDIYKEINDLSEKMEKVNKKIIKKQQDIARNTGEAITKFADMGLTGVQLILENGTKLTETLASLGQIAGLASGIAGVAASASRLKDQADRLTKIMEFRSLLIEKMNNTEDERVEQFIRMKLSNLDEQIIKIDFKSARDILGLSAATLGTGLGGLNVGLLLAGISTAGLAIPIAGWVATGVGVLGLAIYTGKTMMDNGEAITHEFEKMGQNSDIKEYKGNVSNLKKDLLILENKINNINEEVEKYDQHLRKMDVELAQAESDARKELEWLQEEVKSLETRRLNPLMGSISKKKRELKKEIKEIEDVWKRSQEMYNHYSKQYTVEKKLLVNKKIEYVTKKSKKARELDVMRTAYAEAKEVREEHKKVYAEGRDCVQFAQVKSLGEMNGYYASLKNAFEDEAFVSSISEIIEKTSSYIQKDIDKTVFEEGSTEAVFKEVRKYLTGATRE